jgi:2'-5' RNA ligase
MRAARFYRYFLGIRPHPRLHPVFRELAGAVNQSVRLDRLHLTLCVIAECATREWFLARRLERAFDGQALHAFPVHLSRLVAGAHGAVARTSGRQDEIQDFYRRLVRLLAPCGIEPLYRKSGLHPHMTLGYDACPPTLLTIPLEWYPDELLLIESEYGLTRHNAIGRWPLLPPRQPLLPFGQPIAATSPARRSAA